ncbi:hypothetical protein VZT92_009227 [Zoarces viviparus]|uniref:Secreted protein n=1 Tax=Zoarces viviparus TaxID=48416 RepID=A0AAW1FIA6_ZOAVI
MLVSLWVLIRAAVAPSSPPPHVLVVAGAYRARQPDRSFSSEPGRPGGRITRLTPNFQHGIVVPGSALRQMDISREKVSFPRAKPTRERRAATSLRKPGNVHFQPVCHSVQHKMTAY